MKNSRKQTVLQNSAPEFLVLVLPSGWRERKRPRQRVTHFREAPWHHSAEPPSANPYFPSPAVNKRYRMSSDVGGFIRTVLPWESAEDKQVRGLLPSTLLGLAANSNSMFENCLKLKVIFLSVTTLLWGTSAYVDLTEGVRMCFLLQPLPNTNTSDCVYEDHVCICGCLYPCRHLHRWHTRQSISCPQTTARQNPRCRKKKKTSLHLQRVLRLVGRGRKEAETTVMLHVPGWTG